MRIGNNGGQFYEVQKKSCNYSIVDIMPVIAFGRSRA
jgi:hypothetical protein